MTKQQKQRAKRALRAAELAMVDVNRYPRRFMDPEGKILATPAQYENAPYEERLVNYPAIPKK